MQSDNPSVTFIGAGNMARALIQGLLNKGLSSGQIRASDPQQTARDAAAQLGVAVFADNVAACAPADVVVLAVKPQSAAEVVKALAPPANALVVSIMAGIDVASLSAWLPAGQPVVRSMPNTPALLGAGMTALYAGSEVSAGQRNNAEFVLQAAGETVWVDQEQALDAVTAVSGSGPAYFFLLMEAMIQAGTALGLEEPLARKLTLQTAYGAALMARASDDPPSTLRENVTSPGGTTQSALDVMREGKLPDVVVAALRAADARSKELAVQFGAAS